MTGWYKNAIFYSLDVGAFYDSNDDGVGDFQGLILKLDYLSGLGVTCIWLLPFFPSGHRDNGFDVTDYYGVDSRFGDLGDFVQFVARCKELGIRVIIDLVINHTSIYHPWFTMARKDKDSPYRSFYVWSDKPKPFNSKKLMFKGEEESLWTYDEEAKQYYLHRFYKEQPDLNIGCPKLRAEIFKIIGFWLSLNVDGFRVDAAEMIIENYGMPKNNADELERFFDDLREFVAAKNPSAVLLAEANIMPSKTNIYLKDNARMHMLFNFFINQYLFLAFTKGDAGILRRAFNKLVVAKENQQWLNFLRHHDELTLTLLSPKDIREVLNRFAPEDDMRIYGTGIRRRLAPLMDNDQRKLQLVYSILFSLPGAVLLRYGDEIGMGDNLKLDGRASVRTPMQWSPSAHAGFSKNPLTQLDNPIVAAGEFSYRKINVLAQQRTPESLLNFVERIITTRKQIPAIGTGKYMFLSKSHRALLIHTCMTNEVTVLFIHNLSKDIHRIRATELFKKNDLVFEIFCDGKSKFVKGVVTMGGFGFMWFKIERV